MVLLFSLTLEGYSQQESNLQKYTPSVLFQKGEWEAVAFFNLYTQNKVRDRDGVLQNLDRQETFLNSNYQFNYGISNSDRFNIGVDLNINRAFYASNSNNPLLVFTDEGDYSRTVLSALGPRLRFVPFKDLANFSIESTFLFPLAKDLESPAFVAHDRYTWWTKFFYDLKISREWRVFLETGFLYRIKRNESQANFFRIPTSAFISYFPSTKVSLYVYGQYAPRFGETANDVIEQFGLTSWFTQVGLGMKYQLLPSLELEASYGNFIASRNDGAGYLINFGVRFIRR